MKKSVSLIVVIIVLCLILLCGGGVYAFFFTDIFRSDKELFFKYIINNDTISEVLSFEELEAYGEKQETTPYTGNGSIKTNNNFEIESMDTSTEELLSNSNITFSSSIDKQNNYAYNKIDLNYTDEETLSVEYANINDYYGLKIESILKKFLTIENNNLKDLATNMGLSESIAENIPDKIDFDELTSQAELFTESELDEIKTTYSNILVENLSNDMFTNSISEDGQSIYTLTITEAQASNIVVKLLEQLENDEIIINKLKEYAINSSGLTEIEADEYVSQLKEQIEELINDLNESSSQETTANDETDTSTNLIISVYVDNKKMTKVEFILDEAQITLLTGDNSITIEYLESEEETEKSSISLQKTTADDTFEYRLVCNSGEDTILDFQIDYTGLSELTQVEEKSILTLNLGDGYELGYTYTNTKDFTGSTDEEQIEESDLYILNDQENPSGTVETFTELLSELNSEQMEEIGVESNPMVYYIPSAIQAIMTSSLSTGDLSNVMLAGEVGAIGLVVYEFAQLGVQLTSDSSNTSNLYSSESEDLLNGAKDICDEIASQEDLSEDVESVDDIDEYIVNEINNYDWASYSTDITCTAIFVSGESTIEIVSLIDGATLRGTLYYGVITWEEIETETENGTSQESSLEEAQKEVFNAQFEAYTGNNKTASEAKTLITAMIASNASESTYGENRYVSLNYDGTIYDENDLKDFDTSTIDSSSLYNITAEDYDEETGYISVITVEKNENEENTETESNSVEINF